MPPEFRFSNCTLASHAKNQTEDYHRLSTTVRELCAGDSCPSGRLFKTVHFFTSLRRGAKYHDNTALKIPRRIQPFMSSRSDLTFQISALPLLKPALAKS